MERFWNKVDKSGNCWEWMGAKRLNNYGCIKINGKTVSVHRYSYELHFGKIPQGMLVIHRCDNKICVNPKHLRIGTSKDNFYDAISRGKITMFKPGPNTGSFKSGESHPNHKLTSDQVVEIRKNYKPREVSLRILAEKYGVDKSLIGKIIHRNFWRTI